MVKIRPVKDYQDVVRSYYLSYTPRNKYLFQFFKPLSYLSVRLYNQCIYYAKLMYEHNEMIPSVETITYNCTHAEPPFNFYKQIQQLSSDDFASKTLRLHYTCVQSFEGLKKTDVVLNGSPQFPYYKDITEVQMRSFSTRVRLKKGQSNFSSIVSKTEINGKIQYFIQVLKSKNIWIPLPFNCVTDDLMDCNGINEVQFNFIPITINKYKIQIVYRKPIQNFHLDQTRKIFIDLGVNGFATCITTDPTLYPFILNGKEIQSVNHYTINTKISGSRICRITSKIDKYVQDHIIPDNIIASKTNLVKSIRHYRNNRIHDIFVKYVRFIIDYCIQYNIGTIVIGQNKGWKQYTKQQKGRDGNRKFGKNNTREFQNIPYDKFKFLLEYNSKLIGNQYHGIDESYTSQVDHLIGESMEYHPSVNIEGIKRNYVIYDQDKKPILTRKGKKMYNKHLFISQIGKVINADVNGAMGIGRKFHLENGLNDLNFSEHVNLKTIFTPVRITYHSLNIPKFDRQYILQKC